MYLFQSVQTMIYMVRYHDIAQKEKTNKSMPMKSVRTCKRVLFCLAPHIYTIKHQRKDKQQGEPHQCYRINTFSGKS